MVWTTPITDRSKADILAENSKAYMNVADWVRIYDNLVIIKNYAEAFLETTISFTEISTPTISTIPTDTNVNNLATNINNIRTALGITDIPELKNNWVGNAYPAPNYMQINQWERNILWIYEYLHPILSGYILAEDGSILLMEDGNLIISEES